ncbi:carboxypeptidase regulatory-like domain-containing protein [Longimicrobium sp.]|uniref:carboxypeptidase regulatory-like domain-containing protein n=1 Tax=Longimicrobium sp. TaxID=2029185 RepID=UPI003B3AFAC3
MSLARILILTMSLALPAAASAQAVQGRLIGRGTQAPVHGGTVHLMAADSQVVAQAQTDSAGRFTLQAPGRYWLLGSAPGYEASETDLFPVEAQGARVSFVIGRSAVVLETVTATGLGAEDRLWYGGFHQRMDERNGGRFITAEQIDRQRFMQMIDLLRSIPSFEVIVGASGGDSRSFRVRMRHPLSIRGHCWTNIYLNGMRVEAESIQNLNPAEVEGVEIYTSAIPAQFNSSMGGACGVIVIWMKAR